VIIDVHSHLPRAAAAAPSAPAAFKAPPRPDATSDAAPSLGRFVQAMQVVDRAIVFNLASDPGGLEGPEWFMGPARQINDEIAAFVREHAPRFIGFLSVHPRDPNCLDEIERGVSDLGLKGIKLGPNYQHFDPLSSEAFRVYRRAEELRLPILLHQGTSPDQFAELDYAHPRHIDRVAIAFPELRMVLAHMAHPWQIDCIAVIRKHPHVYADVSALFYRPWSHYNCLRLATEWSVLHKLLFGSDCPAAATPMETMDRMRQVNSLLAGTALPPVPEEAIEEIIHRNSLALLGLE
jgi:uncharacterized protein